MTAPVKRGDKIRATPGRVCVVSGVHKSKWRPFVWSLTTLCGEHVDGARAKTVRQRRRRAGAVTCLICMSTR